jgi:hypothetical protein
MFCTKHGLRCYTVQCHFQAREAISTTRMKIPAYNPTKQKFWLFKHLTCPIQVAPKVRHGQSKEGSTNIWFQFRMRHSIRLNDTNYFVGAWFRASYSNMNKHIQRDATVSWRLYQELNSTCFGRSPCP